MPDVYNICLWNSEYLFARTEFISLIEIKTGKVVKKFNSNKKNSFNIISMRKGYIPQYKNCLLTQSSNDHIMLFIIKKK
jgi:hypothetical protein